MKNILKIFLLVIVLVMGVFAQGSSIYSRYGIGDLYNAASARRIGLGGMGIALEDKNYLSDINPATWNRLGMTRFEIGVTMDKLSVESYQGKSTFNEFSLTGLTIGVPIEKDLGISLVGGMSPYSNVDYTISFQQHGEIAGDYLIDYSGSGGVSKLFLGTSYRLPFDWSVGFAYEYYTGKIDYYSAVTFPDSMGYSNGGYKKNNQYRGMGYTVGLISGNLASVFDSKIVNEIRLGFSYNKIASLKTDTTLYAVSSLGSVNLASATVDTKIPDKVGIGLKVRLFEDYNFVFDYVTQDWTQFSLNDIKSDYLNTMERFSLGMEYQKHDVTALTPTLEQICWRWGLSFGSTNYKINGNAIDQFSAFAGMSYPLDFGSSLDFGFEYTTRGKTENNLLRENIYKVYFAISIGELWFMRQEK